MVDRAWPFPHGKVGDEDRIGADQCKKIFGREISCGLAWGEEERKMVGVLVGVAVAVFVVKVRDYSGAVGGAIWPVEVVRLSGCIEPC